MPGTRQDVIENANEPVVSFGRSTTSDLEASLRREWLVTNGLGGYASASLPGVLTRSYHGLLVAALDPPVERTVLVATLDEQVCYGGAWLPLSTHEFTSGVQPSGYVHLASFHLEEGLPVWVYCVSDAIVERRIWMDYGHNTTYVRYRLIQGSLPVGLKMIPLVTSRTFHALTRSGDHEFSVEAGSRSAMIAGGAVPYQIRSDVATFTLNGSWWWDFHYRQEAARGLGDTGDLFAVGSFDGTLDAGDSITLALTTETDITAIDAETSLSQARARQRYLIDKAGAADAIPGIRQLVLAADQLIVSRSVPGAPNGHSIIAGYPWFNDWGRDTMISLPGLCLATGRWAEAESILRTFSQFVQDGLLPNNFPDHAGVIPGYNTADATLWYILAIDAFAKATGDNTLAFDLLPVMNDIVEHHQSGTRYGIGVDPGDGLLRAGEPGVQLTWMDAKVGEWVVTPRIGKPVEINALWYNVLRVLSRLHAAHDKSRRASESEKQAERVKRAFLSRFRQAGTVTLADVVDGPAGDDWTVRPNQVFAVSLPYPLITGTDAITFLDAIARPLLTDFGLRSLAPDDAAYRGCYGGDQVNRDGSYHQGAVWGWLLGAYVEARFRADGDREAALQRLQPIVDHLSDAGLGSISEIFDGDAPHRPNGCFAQAWSVAEILRVWRFLDESTRP